MTESRKAPAAPRRSLRVRLRLLVAVTLWLGGLRLLLLARRVFPASPATAPVTLPWLDRRWVN